MSKRYAPDHKALVLRLLDYFKGDVMATSRFADVPERTLRDWIQQRIAQRWRQANAQSPQNRV